MMKYDSNASSIAESSIEGNDATMDDKASKFPLNWKLS